MEFSYMDLALGWLSMGNVLLDSWDDNPSYVYRIKLWRS
jgi:hypothetical protein